MNSSSSLLCDYQILNQFLDSNQFDKSFQIYSSIRKSDDFLHHLTKFDSLERSFQELFNEIRLKSNEEIDQLKEIVSNPLISSLICSFDFLLQICFHEEKIRRKQFLSDQHEEKEKETPSHEKMSFNQIDYSSKFDEYQVNRLKMVHLEKRLNEPLGLTISRLIENENRISIQRILYGSVAQQLFHVGDQIVEINEIHLQSQLENLDQIVQFINSLQGSISFLILPSQQNQHENFAFQNEVFSPNSSSNPNENEKKSEEYVRCLFDNEQMGEYPIPCRDLSIAFRKGQIFEIVDKSDRYWWQAFPLHPNEQFSQRKKDLFYPFLIPSREFLEKRFQIVKYFLEEQDEEIRHSKEKEKSLSRKAFLSRSNIGTYESVQWFVPSETMKRPIVFIGAPHIGRHEFRQSLMNCEQLSSLIDVAIPHTTREKKFDEIDGRDYHFITRQQFEEEISKNLFVEFGEFERNLYGTSKTSIERCSQQLNKICILNLLPEGLEALKYSNLFPYVIYFQVPSSIEFLSKDFHFNLQQWKEIQLKSSQIEENYSNYFDQMISLTDSFDSILSKLKLCILQIQSQSMWINQSWFSPQRRF